MNYESNVQQAAIAETEADRLNETMMAALSSHDIEMHHDCTFYALVLTESTRHSN